MARVSLVRPDTEHLPAPIEAGIGLVATGVEKARRIRLDGLAELPIRGLGIVARTRETVERTYEELANRGETIVARWRNRPEPRQTTRAPERITLPGAVLAHDQLPLEDYDHLTLGSLRARLAKLDPVALNQLRDYERTHANRLPVLTVLENRIAKVGR
jgi:hypothetical protein